MKKSIDTLVQSVAKDNAQYINEGGYNSIADYIIVSAENGCGWKEWFDDSELDEPNCEPSEEQVKELKNYLNDNYDFLPE